MPTDKIDDQAIFEIARNLPSAEARQAYLQRVRGERPELALRVTALLRAYEESPSFLESPPVAVPPTLDQSPLEQPGTVIGPYKLLEQIGEGGMGVVFMAEQTAPVRRKVALKVIRPGMDTKHVIARFEAERQALAIMDHANIAKIHDAGATDSGRPYFVMELVRGVPITDYCDQYALDTRSRMELFIDVCRAVQHAHQKGVIHRDIKPTNVLVSRNDAASVAKVIDFGIAKAMSAEMAGQTAVTGFKQLLGTPLYMSPEQAEMNNLDVDTRSDVYSLGVLLYELLTGHTPFDKRTFDAADYDELRRLIREVDPPRPSNRLSTLDAEKQSTLSARRGVDVRELSRHLRGELDWIVMKSLEKDRARRYASAEDLARDVERYLHDQPVEACPPSAAYRCKKFAKRNKGVLAATGLVAAALLLGTGVSAWQAIRATEAEQLAEANADESETNRKLAEANADESETHRKLAEANAQESESNRNLAEANAEESRANAELAQSNARQAADEAAVARAVVDFLQNDLLDEAAPRNNPRQEQVTVEELLGRAAARIGGKFGAEPAVESAIRLTIGETYLSLGNYQAAETQLVRGRELTRSLYGDDSPKTLDATNDLAGALQMQGRYDEAEALFVATLDGHRRILGEEHDDTLTSLNNLGALYAHRGDYARAEPLYLQALEIRIRVSGNDHVGTLGVLNNLGSLYRELQRYAEAEPIAVRVLDGCRRLRGDEDYRTLTAANNLATVYTGQGKFAEAEPLLIRTLESRRRVLGNDHRETFVSLGNLAECYRLMGQHERAQPLAEEALEARRRVLGAEHPETLVAMDNLAEILLMKGPERDRAETLLGEVLEIRRRVQGSDHKDVLHAMERLATACLYRKQGGPERAVALCVEALAVRRRVHGDADADTLLAMRELATLYLVREDLVNAEPLLVDALTVIRGARGDDHIDTFKATTDLAGVYVSQRKYAQAEPLLLSAYERFEKLAASRADGNVDLRACANRLARMYEAWGKPDEAAKWRQERQEQERRQQAPERRSPDSD